MVDTRFVMGSKVRVTEGESVPQELRGRTGRVAVPPTEMYPDEVSVTLDGDEAPKLFNIVDLSPHEDEVVNALKRLWQSNDFTEAEKGLVRWRHGLSRPFENALFNMVNAAADTRDINRVRGLFPQEHSAVLHWRGVKANAATSPFMKRLTAIGFDKLP